MNSVRSNNISLKYQRFMTLCSKDIGIIKSEFVAKTQFLKKLRKENIAILIFKDSKKYFWFIVISFRSHENLGFTLKLKFNLNIKFN